MTEHINGAQPQIVQPQPAPMTWQIAQVEVNGQKLIVLQVHHRLGTFTAFLDLVFAKNIAAQIDNAATQAGSGIIVPPPGMRF
jgi:hypothetical protein